MTRLRYTRRALADLLSIADHVQDRSPAGAVQVRMAIEAAVETIVLYPQSGRLVAPDGVRKSVTRRFGYIVYYRMDEDTGAVAVLSIQHSAQDHADWEA